MTLQLSLLVLYTFASMAFVILLVLWTKRRVKSYSQVLYYINCALLGLLPVLLFLQIVNVLLISPGRGADVLKYSELILSSVYGTILLFHIVFNRHYFLMPVFLILYEAGRSNSKVFQLLRQHISFRKR